MRFITNLLIDQKKIDDINRVIVQDQFHEQLEAIRQINLNFRQRPSITEQEFPPDVLSSQALLNQIEPVMIHDCDARNGMEYAKSILFSGYDESKAKFLALEGEAQLTTHVVTQVIKAEIVPTCKVSFYFYSKSSLLEQQSNYVKYSNDITSDSNLDYIHDRNELLVSSVFGDSVLFIDGPLIGGNISGYNLRLVGLLHQKNILPVFIVKNSESSLVIDNSPEFRGKYNSDLHWAYSVLKPGQRSALFQYTDQINHSNSKVFCYIKPFYRVTTQRIEFSVPSLIMQPFFCKFESEISIVL